MMIGHPNTLSQCAEWISFRSTSRITTLSRVELDSVSGKILKDATSETDGHGLRRQKAPFLALCSSSVFTVVHQGRPSLPQKCMPTGPRKRWDTDF